MKPDADEAGLKEWIKLRHVIYANNVNYSAIRYSLLLAKSLINLILNQDM